MHCPCRQHGWVYGRMGVRGEARTRRTPQALDKRAGLAGLAGTVRDVYEEAALQQQRVRSGCVVEMVVREAGLACALLAYVARGCA